MPRRGGAAPLRIRVVRVNRRRRAGAARAMRAAGWPSGAIRAALGLSAGALARALTETGLWGALASHLAHEMRDAA